MSKFLKIFRVFLRFARAKERFHCFKGFFFALKKIDVFNFLRFLRFFIVSSSGNVIDKPFQLDPRVQLNFYLTPEFLLIEHLCNLNIFKTQKGHTTATAPAPASSLHGSNSCGLVEIHGAGTLLFLVFAANVSTHIGPELCDTHTSVHTRTHQWLVFTPTQQAGRSYLVCLPVCLPTVFSLLLRCAALGPCLM